jgi:hypothetical protein
VATLTGTSRALPRPETRPEPRDAAEWLRANGVVLAGVTLIAIQLWWKGALLAHSYFRQDDFRFLDRALGYGFSWKYLLWVEAGHLLPLGMAITWVLARLSLYNWPLTSAVTLALLAAACLAMLRVLRTLFGSRPAILIPLAVFLFSPLTLVGVLWWSVGLEILPLELAICMAVDAHVRYLRGRRLRHALAAAFWLLAAMAAMDKGAVLPLLLLALTSAFFVEGRWAAAVGRALTRYWKAWALYAVLLAGYCAVFFTQLPGSSTQPGDPGPASHVVDLAATMVGTTLLPGAAGGPWHWSAVGFAQGSPPAALQQLAWAVAALVVVASCAGRVRAWRAWAILAGWIVVADIVPVVLGRLGTQSAALLGAQTRYVTDATPILAICIGLAFLPLAGEQDAYRFRLPGAPPAGGAAPAGAVAETGAGVPATRAAVQWGRVAVAAVLAAFLAGSFWSLQSLETVTNTTAAQSYIATARAALAGAPPGTLIVSGPTPTMIMDPGLFWREGYTSQVIGALARGEPGRHLSWTLSPHGVIGSLMTFDAQGQLRPAAVAGPSSVPLPARACWRVTGAGVRIPLAGSLYRWPWTARLDYAGPAATLDVRFGGNWTAVPVPAGTHAVYVPVLGAGQAVTVRLVGPAGTPAVFVPVLGLGAGATPPLAGPSSPAGPAPCVTGVTVGSLHPDPAAPAIPASPVPG